ERYVNPRPGGVKIQMPGAEAMTITRSDGNALAEHAIAVFIYLECSGVLLIPLMRPERFVAGIAAGDKDGHAAVRRHAHLVRKNSEVQIGPLWHRRAYAAIGLDAEYPQSARYIGADEHMPARRVRGHVQRSQRQRGRFAVHRQRTGGLVYLQRAH